jgi:replicative DNA helicase
MRADAEASMPDSIVTGSFEWPRATEMEQAVIGAMIAIPEYAAEGLGFLQAEDLYHPEHQYIFESIQLNQTAGLSVDIATVVEMLQEMGVSEAARRYARELGSFPTILCVEQLRNYMQVIRDHRIRRDVIALSYDNIELALAEIDGKQIVEKVSGGLLKIADTALSDSGVGKSSKVTSTVMASLLERKENPNTMAGLSTGWHELDKMTGGFQGSDLIIIAARPSMGKTAFVLNFIQNTVLCLKKPGLIFSLEMSKEQLVQRMLSSMSGLDSQNLRNGMITDMQWKLLNLQAEKLMNAELFIDEGANLTPAAMRARAKQIMMDTGNRLGVVCVDYLQLMSGSGRENRVQDVSEISRSLKTLAMELKVPVIALSQLSREVEKRADKRPMLSDLRDSGAIEQDADTVIFLYRDDYYNKSKEEQEKNQTEDAEIIISKQRNGPTGVVNLRFNKPLTRFENKM